MRKLPNVGKLYQCPQYHLFVYSSFKAVITADDYTDSTSLSVYGIIFRNDKSIFEALEEVNNLEKQWWFKEPVKITIHPANHPMMVVDLREYNGQTFIKIISGEKIGWVIYRTWFDLDMV